MVWMTRKLTYVVFISVAGFIYSIAISQIASIFSNIPGSNYFFIIGNAILIGLAVLLYNGERWFFFLQGLLITFLVTPIIVVSSPFGLFTSIPLIINALQGDCLQCYTLGFFKKHKQKMIWSIIMTIEFYMVSIILTFVNFFLFFTPEVAMSFIIPMLLVIPIIIIEASIGAFIGFKAYERLLATRIIAE